MTTAILFVLAGLVGLFVGGELLVRGAVGIARRAGLSPVLTGVVIVGLGTSMPELVASVEAARAGSPEIAWGNIAGSNIANSLLILGATALIAPIALNGLGKRDAAVALGASILLMAVAATGFAGLFVGLVFLAALFAYLVWRAKHPREDVGEDEDIPSWLRSGLFFLIGLAVLAGGANILIDGAIDLALMAGISETVIGLTIVAVGTSLPELAACVAAAWRGQPGLAIGNVVGSNIFNILLIGGVTMAIAPVAVPYELVDVELPLLLASALLIWLLLWRARSIGRALGLVLLGAFAANTAWVLA